ncbi:MAG: hypothetical protein RLZZ480_567 [Candidatus Parcubacteria bacterium]|jgi:hypothetical protein
MKKDPTENSHQLGNLLARYKNLFKPPQASIEKEFIAAVEMVCGITLLPHQVEYKVTSKTIIIKAPSLLRSELLLHRDSVLREVTSRVGVSSAPQTIL